MAQSNFQVGDIVTLKSGSPKMTINEIITTEIFYERPSKELEINIIKVDWFDGSNVQHAKFKESQLEKYNISNEPEVSKS